MTQTTFIPFLLPGLNDIIKSAKSRRGNWSGYAAQKKEVQEQIHPFLTKFKPCEKPVYVTFVWVEKHRKRDLDNIAAGKKFIFDALVKQKILKNDGWKHVKGWTDEFNVSKDSPGVFVILQE